MYSKCKKRFVHVNVIVIVVFFHNNTHFTMMNKILILTFLNFTDICDLNPNICGMEAGCYATNGTYICLCHDLLPAGPGNDCERKKGELNVYNVI